MEPFVARVGRFFLSIGALGFLLFLITDYQGEPQWSWMCASWSLMAVGFGLWWPNRHKRVSMGVELPEPPEPKPAPPPQAPQQPRRKGKKKRRKRKK